MAGFLNLYRYWLVSNKHDDNNSSIFNNDGNGNNTNIILIQHFIYVFTVFELCCNLTSCLYASNVSA